MKKIFIVTYGGGHVNIIKSIYQELKSILDAEVIILALTTAPNVLKKTEIPYITISEISKKLDNYNIIRLWGEKLAKTNHKSDSGIDYEDTVAYFGIGYIDLMKQHGQEKADNLFQQFGRKVFLPVITMKKMLSIINPDVVVITTSPRMEKAAGIAANQLGIPVVKICDLPKVDPVEYRCKVCVMNEWSKQYAISDTNLDSVNIKVTGQPVFEKNLNIDLEIKQKYIDEVKQGHRECILYLGQTGNADTETTVSKLYQFAKNNPDKLVIIRPHPNDQIRYVRDGLDNFIITKEGELKYLISMSELVVTHYSTAGLEAALMGKPLITVLINSPKSLRYSEYGIAIEINNINDLEYSIKKCLYDNRVRSKLKDRLKQFKNQENAAGNIIKVIEAAMNERENKYNE